MSTPAHALINRANSLHSTGPCTPEGKAASSRNATSHGLSSAGDPVLPHEERSQFDNLLQRYSADFAPTTAHEEFLVGEMAAARWRIQRADRLEILILSGQSHGDSPDPDLDIANSMRDKDGDPVARIARHRAALERSYQRCAREFRASRKFQNEATAAELADKLFAKFLERFTTELPPGYQIVPKLVHTPPSDPDPEPSEKPLQNEPNSAAPPAEQNAKNPARSTVKIGRNDRCLCGSGLKYKKCCLQKASQLIAS